ncbi:Carbon monoxide dehydrogenase subunit G [Actinokineospora alba]|uniref:Carbon monoxide dehydrogenase subunit G n=1 Tax=Actinokineospora alba TaxID=504798 RepID=A0A1H0PDB1_9PSEU|nr:carbon monoxide dehydrogenase subunit G [Actinokineospora alba]SDP02596.1 Carbon monoxide dehydrogenase subunit G [Actinokineospora alba]
MQLEHRFTVPADIDTVWAALMDPERVAPCMPGATLTEYSGTTFTGTVKVKVGPISLLYKGSGEFVETDEDAHRTTIKASGKDSRGNGTATATVTVTLVENGTNTDGEVRTDLAITGKPAQFGRGLISEVGTKILNTFADCLAKKLAPKPAQPTQAGQSAQPAQAGKSAQPVQSAQAGKSAQPVQSAQAGKSAQPAQAGQSTQPVQSVQPAQAGQSTRSGEPSRSAQPSGQATQAAQAGQPAQPADLPVSATIPTAPSAPNRPSTVATPSATGQPRPTAATSSPTKTDEREAPEIPTQPTPSRTLRAVPEFETEPIDLMEIATHSLKKRLLPAAVAALVVALVVILRRRR